MSYLVLARKYRPTSFSSVAGQEHVTRTLANAIQRNKVGHAFLFTGPRGVGKTSIARIFSRALNCEKGATAEPCGACPACREIAAGTSLAVREIDGASHNSVDHVRDLIDSFRSPPPPGYRYKVYIIDEVHMLSTAAFNALLKSLEEPPPFTVFILATTEIHKIPDTVVSRCHRHDFRALSVADIAGRLGEIAVQEKIEIEHEALQMLARLADGSLRDGQSLLDRVQSFSQGTVTAKEVGMVLGIVDRATLLTLASHIFGQRPGEALSVLHRALDTGLDIGLFLREFAALWRELIICRFAGASGAAEIGLSPDEFTAAENVLKQVNPADLQDVAELAREGSDGAIRSAYPKYALEALLVRLATRQPVVEIGAALQRIRQALAPDGRPAVRQSAALSPPRRESNAAADTLSRTERAPAQEAAGRALSWEEFVRNADSGGSKILVEHLRRLSIQSFSPGIVRGQGPDFTVDYFKIEENRRKLVEKLNQYAQHGEWKLELARSGKGQTAEPGSIVHQETVARTQLIEGKKENVANHPTVKSLQKYFPGTQIENIKIQK